MDPERRTRLPTLLEVLEQRAAAPVDLNAFYQFTLKHGEEDALDFWLDVCAHERLCAIYLYLDNGSAPVPLTGAWRGNLSKRRTAYVHMDPHEHSDATETKVTLFDLAANAQRVYEQYLVPHSEHELMLPATVHSTMQFPSETHALTGDVNELLHMFQVPKNYVFAHLEQSLYPTFLQRHAFSNIVPLSAWARLSCGLLLLWVAFSTGFSFVFLNTERTTRIWILLPMALATYFVASYWYNIDPALALAQKTELGESQLGDVDEPSVRALHAQHAITAVVVAALVCAALTVLFVFVPGHRL